MRTQRWILFRTGYFTHLQPNTDLEHVTRAHDSLGYVCIYCLAC